MNNTTKLCLLLCHRDVAMGESCLNSIRRFCTQKLDFRIHDDGSLTAHDIDALLKHGDVELVARQEADQRMDILLEKFPNCRKLRRSLPYAIKLLDTILLGNSDNYAYIDSDILFLRRFANPFRANEYTSRSVFMRDRENSYCIRSWSCIQDRRFRFPNRLNAGFIIFDRALFDLDFAEWFLSRPETNAIPSMREQSTWALLGKRVNCEIFDEDQVRVMREGEPEDQLVAGHFTAKTRFLLPRYAEQSSATDANTEPAVLRTKPCGNCSPLQIAWYEIRRLLRKLTGSNT